MLCAFNLPPNSILIPFSLLNNNELLMLLMDIFAESDDSSVV
jgi:hypothetical protein